METQTQCFRCPKQDNCALRGPLEALYQDGSTNTSAIAELLTLSQQLDPSKLPDQWFIRTAFNHDSRAEVHCIPDESQEGQIHPSLRLFRTGREYNGQLEQQCACGSCEQNPSCQSRLSIPGSPATCMPADIEPYLNQLGLAAPANGIKVPDALSATFIIQSDGLPGISPSCVVNPYCWRVETDIVSFPLFNVVPPNP